jgi:hypothetical protein
LPELRDGQRSASWWFTGKAVRSETVYRLGITPSAIDQTFMMLTASGKCLPFTQLNQYHVVYEVKPISRIL